MSGLTLGPFWWASVMCFGALSISAIRSKSVEVGSSLINAEMASRPRFALAIVNWRGAMLFKASGYIHRCGMVWPDGRLKDDCTQPKSL